MSSKLTLLAVPCFLALAQPLAAQCGLTWSPGNAQPHLSGHGRCSTLWDPDGAGPLPQRLVVGGQGLLGGSQLLGGTLPSIQRVMTWDGSMWQSLGSGPGGTAYASVDALTVWNGELIAGGGFTTAGGPDYIARWDGAAWQPLGSGFPGQVVALTVWNGNLVAASYTGSGTVTSPILQVWNGVTWTALPSPPTLTKPEAMLSFEGELCVAGSATLPLLTQGVLERWNGTSWATSITAQGPILSLAMRPSQTVGGSDTLYAAGTFTGIGGASQAHVASTTGAPSFTWSGVGGGLPNSCWGLHVRNTLLTDFILVALTGSATTPVMRFTSSNNSWTALGDAHLNAVALYAGSYHGMSSWTGQDACLRWDGAQWVSVRGPGIVGQVRALTRSGDDMVIGGTFATISGTTMNGVARWNGSTFTPLGTGMVGASVDALVTLDNGDIVAGGAFVAAGGTAANNIARWNGTAWSPMGGGFDQPVYALCKMPNGDVIAGGAFTMEVGAPVLSNHVARWNGTTWSPMHFGMNDDVLALVVRNDGTLFAGGRFTIASTFSRYRVAQWTGTVWGQVGAAMNDTVHGLAARPNGDIVAVGEFTQASLQTVDRCARWNGSTWVSMGAASGDAGIPRAVFALPNGDVVAGRGFHQPTATADAGISRWDGSTWNWFSFLTGPTTTAPVDVRTIVQRADGDLVLGGTFNVAGFTMSYALASLQSTCMPSAAPYGTGCSSAAGPLVITADALPWTSATFRTTTTGIAPGSLCVGIIGLTQLSIPLDSLLVEGQPGCFLLASLDIQMLLLPDGAGEAHSAFALANDPSLIGVPFFQQSVPIEFDSGGAIVAIRGSNALALTIGTL